MKDPKIVAARAAGAYWPDIFREHAQLHADNKSDDTSKATRLGGPSPSSIFRDWVKNGNEVLGNTVSTSPTETRLQRRARIQDTGLNF